MTQRRRKHTEATHILQWGYNSFGNKYESKLKQLLELQENIILHAVMLIFSCC